ncbi:MAG TPA: hypothetical protein VJR02_01490 [Pyrinomonadaceae bacterium]|nr:hypothetical protein [Pyrinomonadaceae bacterium]
MAKQRKGLVILSVLAMVLSLTVSTPTQATKREQDRSCTDRRARSDEKPEKQEKRERIELRGTVGPDGKPEKIFIERPSQ